jgi:ubiquitin-conjugating enzyme E2 G2
MKFDPPIFHPNGMCSSNSHGVRRLRSASNAVYPDGTVCISILHAAGDDPNSKRRAESLSTGPG